MTSTALVQQQHLPRTFEDFVRHLHVPSYPVACAVIEPGVGAQFALASKHLAFAGVLIWRAFKAIPGSARDAAGRRLDRIPRVALLATASSGLVGWAGFFAMTALFVWR